jgi:hypothetical protein
VHGEIAAKLSIMSTWVLAMVRMRVMVSAKISGAEQA